MIYEIEKLSPVTLISGHKDLVFKVVRNLKWRVVGRLRHTFLKSSLLDQEILD